MNVKSHAQESPLRKSRYMVDGKAKCVFCFYSLNAICFIEYTFRVPEIGVLTEFKERNFV